MLLLIDSREMKNKSDRRYFERKIPDSKSMNLMVGDFMWIKGNNVINSIIERKNHRILSLHYMTVVLLKRRID